MNIETLQKYYQSGLSLLPVNSIKRPTLESWKDRQKAPVKPNGEFRGSEVTGVAIIGGGVSGGVEAIDFDTKNDLTGTLMSDYRKLLNDEALLKRLVIQRTPSGGYHFIYKCEEVDGNKKLARRETTTEERVKSPKTKVTSMIETRGDGGYFLVDPSKGYKIIQGDILNITVITIEERERLHSCAKSFNSHVPNEPDYKQRKFAKEDGNSPFEEFNKKFDTLELLLSEGWKIVKEKGNAILLRRPDKNDGISATYFQDSKVFYPFTTSSEFEAERGYNPVSVFTLLKCQNDFTIASHKIRDLGYGEQKKSAPKIEVVSKPVANFGDDDIWDWKGTDEYLKALQDGTFELGLGLGMKRVNDHFRLKRGNLNVINGHDNVGKTIVLIFIMLISAKYYDWRWVIYMAENSKKFFMRKCIEFLIGKSLRGVDDKIISKWQAWVKDHFFLVDAAGFYTYDEILKYNEHQMSKRKIDGLLIDPYNSLKPNYGSESAKINMHQYDYEVMNTFRGYTKQNDCCIYLNCHAVTSALRKVDKDGYLIAPNRADTEGGLKFASKADDFLTIHRLTNHPTDWMNTDIHVRKIKEQETGGMPTPKDKPLKIQMMIGGVGFVDEYGWNPILEKQFDPIQISKQEENREMPNEFSMGANPDKFTEPAKQEDESFPF